MLPVTLLTIEEMRRQLAELEAKDRGDIIQAVLLRNAIKREEYQEQQRKKRAPEVGR